MSGERTFGMPEKGGGCVETAAAVTLSTAD
jgi:hypothetical protein